MCGDNQEALWSAEAVNSKRTGAGNAGDFLYNATQFSPLPVRLDHIDIHLDFRDRVVETDATLWMTARRELELISLDARDLEILAVRSGDADGRPLDYEYVRECSQLRIRLAVPVKEGDRFSIQTVTSCIPSDNILEGIYKDTTPPGAPQQYISQCQQWGFQRIMPILDDCTAKCTMRTTIEADARYTHVISNGDVYRPTNPDGKPIPKADDASRQVITYDNSIPMAPYLFLVCVGTYDVHADEVVYPSGRRVRLEYLVPPGRTADAVVPMEILKRAIVWQRATQDYEYAREVYRTICMEKSNFGGMENVGNTTILTSAALIDRFTTDARLQYCHGVIVHEFEHNQCGSDVTMETPFDMWLNEALTVDVERQFEADVFDPVSARLNEVDAMRSPISGPLAIEEGGHLGRIVREGFNDPDELVDGVTYVKAAEVIRMLRLVLGPAIYRDAKNTYFRRYAGGNANTDQFFSCFEEISGRDLGQFKREWLYRAGYPSIVAMYEYNDAERRLRIVLKQTQPGKPFHVPVELAAVDAEGRDVPATSGVIELTSAERELVFENVARPAFISLNRDCSFYGTMEDASSTVESLRKQIMLDPNGFNRVEAMRRLTDIQRVRLIRDIDAGPDEQWLEVYGQILRDESISPVFRAHLLRIDESSLDRRYLPCYRKRYHARARLLQIVVKRYYSDFIEVCHATDTYSQAQDPKIGLEERKLKAVLLRTIIEMDTHETHRLAEDHFRQAWNMSDKVSALHCINLSSHPGRTAILDEALGLWQHNISAYSSYLGVIGAGVHDDVFDRMALEEERPLFKPDHPGHSRSLYLPMGANNKMLWTERGIRWMTDTVIRLSVLNENTAIRLLASFQLVHKLDGDLQREVVRALEQMSEKVDPSVSPSVSGRLAAYLS